MLCFSIVLHHNSLLFLKETETFVADGVLYSLFAWVWILQIFKYLAVDKYLTFQVSS